MKLLGWETTRINKRTAIKSYGLQLTSASGHNNVIQIALSAFMSGIVPEVVCCVLQMQKVFSSKNTTPVVKLSSGLITKDTAKAQP